MLAAAGLGADVPHAVQHGLSTRMKTIIEQDLPLPNASGILAMADMVYADRPQQSRGLRASLARFDELIGQVR